ncbi:DUF3152 domain-containing protein [Demequina globuliformis]|uniref:DUF3152 domain-containing protein n=1 Tax=Demequina globuliformis TaxID=676202 RepID=UPI000782E372|nr:DUF3152 domain-containing protein [Demequina globuliformis]
MNQREKGLFAGRGIHLPSLKAIALTVGCAFVAGIAVGWGTGLVGGNLAAPEPSVTPTPTAEPTSTVDVSLPPLEPLDRELDDADRDAGITSLVVPEAGDGVYTTVTADAEATGSAQAVRYVRVDVENGLALQGDAVAAFVLDSLNDPRGWGASGRYEYVPTTGAADIRVALATPYTAAATCPTPHAPASVGAQPTATAQDSAEPSEDGSAEPSAEPSGAPSSSATAASPVEDGTCADRGLIMISAYDWAAGLDAYGDDRQGARDYFLNHGVGHVLGEEDGICASGRALVMTDQRELSDDCEPNPWPFPDQPLPDPSASPSPTATRSDDE